MVPVLERNPLDGKLSAEEVTPVRLMKRAVPRDSAHEHATHGVSEYARNDGLDGGEWSRHNFQIIFSPSQ